MTQLPMSVMFELGSSEFRGMPSFAFSTRTSAHTYFVRSCTGRWPERGSIKGRKASAPRAIGMTPKLCSNAAYRKVSAPHHSAVCFRSQTSVQSRNVVLSPFRGVALAALTKRFGSVSWHATFLRPSISRRPSLCLAIGTVQPARVRLAHRKSSGHQDASVGHDFAIIIVGKSRNLRLENL
jgi:hypothetical protein